jgi:hypothetical protein
LEIHKPKPWHGWREFLKEYGIIVLGVVTALAAEQAVEKIHERRLAEEAQQNISAEIDRNLGAMDRRAATQDCVDRRLDELQAIIDRARAGAPVPRPLWVGRPPIYELDGARWQTAGSAGRVSLLSPEQQFVAATLYLRFGTFTEAQTIEQAAWSHLRTLEVDPTLSFDAAQDLEKSIEEARYANWRIKVAERQAHSVAVANGYRATDLGTQRGSSSHCLPLATSREDALRILARGRMEWSWEP